MSKTHADNQSGPSCPQTSSEDNLDISSTCEPYHFESNIEIEKCRRPTGCTTNEIVNSTDITLSNITEGVLSNCDTVQTAHSSNSSAHFDIRSFLKQYAIDNHQTHSSINYLLQGLRNHSCFKDLPTDARTLLGTSRSETKKIVTVEPGKYYHVDIAKHLSYFLDRFGVVQNIELMIGIDGLPLTASSKSSFWPILGYVWPFKSHIFMIGIYWGLEKPNSSNQYLHVLLC